MQALHEPFAQGHGFNSRHVGAHTVYPGFGSTIADFDPTAVGTFDYEKSEWQISHPMWVDERTIVVWGPHRGSIHYHLYDDSASPQVQAIGPGELAENGHMSFHPRDRRWMLSDTYPDDRTHERQLFIYDMKT